jgi:hypothetical protein
MGEERKPRRSWAWAGAGIVLVAAIAGVVWVGVSGVRIARNEPPSGRPASVLPPSKELPIALWSETTEPVVNLQGDIRLGYEKLPRLRRKDATVSVRLEMIGPQGESQLRLKLGFRRPLPGRSGQLALGALLAAVNQQAAVSPQLSGKGQLVIALGERGKSGLRPLSNDVVIRCVFEQEGAGTSEAGAK